MKYFWLSFRDPDKNLHLGSCIITDVFKFERAIQRTLDLEINPGGEVLGGEITERTAIAQRLDFNKLYSRQELLDRGYKTGI